jgi:hypothetical protein
VLIAEGWRTHVPDEVTQTKILRVLDSYFESVFLNVEVGSLTLLVRASLFKSVHEPAVVLHYVMEADKL